MTTLRNQKFFTALDFESTGVDVDSDRVVSAALAYHYDGEFTGFNTYLVNPGIEIPQGAINIHGITNEQAKNGLDPNYALSIIRDAIEEDWKEGKPLIGHNIGSYDLNLLNADLVRNGLEPLKIAGPILDTMVLARMMGMKKATLAAVAQNYGIVNEQAHDASADAVTSLKILLEMIKRHPSIADTDFRDLYTQQRVAHRTWVAGMKSYFTRIGKTFDNDGSWPVRDKWLTQGV